MKLEMETKLRIHKWPEKILKKKAKKVKKVNQKARDILAQMHVLMKASGGVGLAANQAGISLQLMVIDFEGQIFKLVNPRIVNREGRIILQEGCLSFPGIELQIKRSNKLKVEALNESGERVILSPEGFLAVVFQHEIDHLNGVPFTARASWLQKLRIRKRLNCLKRGGGNGM